MRLKDGLVTMHGPGPRRGSAWHWFPWALAGCMSVVMAVNGAMVWWALGTFPGQAGNDGFDLSNHYNQVLDTMQREAALGWQMRVVADPSGRPVAVLTDRSGAPLENARVEAVAARPLGPPETTHLVFRDDGAGRYVADGTLPAKGQWELQLTAHEGGQSVATTRRVIVQPLPPQQERARPGLDPGSAQSAG